MVEAVTRYPIPDQAAATGLGRVLRGLGYTEDGVYRLLGDDAYSTERDDAHAVAERGRRHVQCVCKNIERRR